MGRIYVLALSAALFCSGECIQVGPPRFGRVEVSAYSILDEPLPRIDIDLIEAGSQKSVKSKFNGAVAANVPYGLYTLRVSAPGFRTSERQVWLGQPELFVRMQLSVSVECGGLPELRGATHPAPGDRELWAKLVPLRGVGAAEARVNADGSFFVGGLNEGQYLLLVIDGNSVVHTSRLTLPKSGPVDVELAKN